MSITLPNKENDYYWNLVLRDGRTVVIPPKSVSLVKQRMDSRQPIHTTNGSIPFAQIESFDRSSRRLTDVKLVEGVAQAFNEPLVTEDGEVKARWVKKEVSRTEYDKRMSKSTFYHFLGEEGGMVTVGFLLPVHRFDKYTMQYCDSNEEQRLEKMY